MTRYLGLIALALVALVMLGDSAASQTPGRDSLGQPVTAYRRYIDSFLDLYAGNSDENPTNIDIRQWGPLEWRSVDEEDLSAIRSLIGKDIQDVWDLIPATMRRARNEGEARFLFQNMILREAQRRGILGDYPERFINEGFSIDYQIPVIRVDVHTPVTMQRGGFEISEILDSNGRSTGRLQMTEAPPARITSQPEHIALRDMAVEIFRNRDDPQKRGRVALRADVYEAVRANTGLPQSEHTIFGFISDRAIFDLGFSMTGDADFIRVMPVGASVSREVYAVLLQVGARIGAGIDVPDDQALVAGMIAGSISRNNPAMDAYVVYPPLHQ